VGKAQRRRGARRRRPSARGGRHPVATWDAAFAALLGDKDPHPYDWFTYSTISHAVLTPGENVEIFVVADGTKAGAIRDAFVKRVTATVCYCSIFDDCWSEGDGHPARPVSECPVPGRGAFQQ
jgi:hypothetical protein